MKSSCRVSVSAELQYATHPSVQYPLVAEAPSQIDMPASSWRSLPSCHEWGGRIAGRRHSSNRQTAKSFWGLEAARSMAPWRTGVATSTWHLDARRAICPGKVWDKGRRLV